MKPPKFECWSCQHALRVQYLHAFGVIHTRPGLEGGPFLDLACPRCRREGIAEQNAAGHWFHFPPGNAGWLDCMISSSDRRAELSDRRAWYERRPGFRAWFFLRLPLISQEPQDEPRFHSHGWDRPAGDWSRSKTPPGSGRSARPEAAPPPPPPPNTPPKGHSTANVEEKARLFRKPKVTTFDEARVLLGLEPGFDRRALKQAYRRLAQLYHPDRFAAMGETFIGLATARFEHIQGAYQLLMESFNR